MNKIFFNTIFSATSVLLTLFLTACSQNASHLPSILDFPSVIGSAFENANYQAKRKKVASYVASHYETIRQDVSKGGGKSLDGAFDVAGIKNSKRNKAKKMLLSGKKQTFDNAGLVADALINVFSVLYVNESTAKDKQINGFSYFDARQLIENYADSNFENLRISIKRGQGVSLDELILRLKIKEAQRIKSFKNKAKSLYPRMYLEPVIVAIMVNT